MEWVDKL